MLLKADTGADINLMNKQTFDQLFGKAKDLLQLTPIKMETMEIQQSKCWEGSMHFYIGRTGFTSKFSMLLTVTDLLTCCLGMLVSHSEFSSLVILWKSSLELVRIPHILLNIK